MRKFRKTVLFLLTISIALSVNAQSTLKERLEQHVYTLASDSLKGRKAGTDHGRMAADYIAAQFEEIGIKPFLASGFLQIFDWKFQNVVGIIPGNDSILKHEYIIVGAHYDHLGVRNGEIYNGADDNASGVAVLIELARELKREQLNLKRSIILVAFDAEEIGLLGSYNFSNLPNISKNNVKLMISIDMVGWYEKSGKVKYQGTGTIKTGKKLILKDEYTPKELNVVAKKFEVIPGTDSYPFRKKGIPTLWVTTGIVSPYHKPQDDAHLIDYNGMALITENLKNVILNYDDNN